MRKRRIATLKPQVYVDPRPPEFFLPFYRFVQSHRIGPLLEVARLLIVPPTMLLYRVRALGSGSLPGGGPVIVAPNHFSTLDHFFVAMYLRRRVNFMAKSQLFRGPLKTVLVHLGAFPVRRGQRDEEAIETALTVLRRGGAVVIYPEGGRSRSASLGDKAKPGVGRLALESGAPVVPVAIHGSQYARNWRYLHFPRVRVKYGSPLRFSDAPRKGVRKEEAQAVADEVLRQIQRLWWELEGRQERKLRELPAAVAAETRRRLEALPPSLPLVRPLRRGGRLREASHRSAGPVHRARKLGEAALRVPRLRAGADLARRLEERRRATRR